MAYLFLVLFLFSNVLGFAECIVTTENIKHYSFETKKEKKSPMFQNGCFPEEILEAKDNSKEKDNFQTILLFTTGNTSEVVFQIFFTAKPLSIIFGFYSKAALFLLHKKFLV